MSFVFECTLITSVTLTIQLSHTGTRSRYTLQNSNEWWWERGCCENHVEFRTSLSTLQHTSTHTNTQTQTQVPRLHRLNVPKKIVHMSLVENPARILAFYKPPKPTMESFAMWTCAQCKKRFPENHTQFSRMEWLYCSVECLQNHRKGMKEFQNWVDTNRSRRDGGNNKNGGNGRSAAWGVKT